MKLSELRTLLCSQDWLTLWEQRDEVDWTYAAHHVPFEIQWRMVVASKVAEAEEWEYDLLNDIPDHVLHAFACDCAERALLREREEGCEPDARSWVAIETKRRWIQGEATDEERVAARAAVRAAARSAAWAAVRTAAWDAAGTAARAAARSAAWAAVRTAAWDAAGTAAWDAAGNKERFWQIQRLAELIVKIGLEPMPREKQEVLFDEAI